MNKIKNTNLININKNNIKTQKINTDICTIKIEFENNDEDILNIKEKINYKYNTILNCTANIYNKHNNNIIYIINPSNIKIIDGFCMIKDENIFINSDYILNVNLHLICDKYQFNQ